MDLTVFWCGISFHLNYEIKYSAISHKLEFQNLISETWTRDVSEQRCVSFFNSPGKQAGGNAAATEPQSSDAAFAGLAWG